MLHLVSFHRLPQAACWMVLLGVLASGAWAQVPAAGESSPPGTLDKRLFDSIYRIETPLFRRTMRTANASAYPVFVGGAATVWLGAWAVRGGSDWSDAYRLTVSELGALGVTFGLKYLVRRTRPYVRFPDVASRTGDIAQRDPYSFPSGHAALAFAMATSWTLSHPKWYVAVPAYLWAACVAVSRVWLGVHYPSDVVFGSLLGAALAWGVHRLGASITPAFLRREGAASARSFVRVRLFLL